MSECLCHGVEPRHQRSKSSNIPRLSIFIFQYTLENIWNFLRFSSKIYSRRAENLQLCFYHFASCVDFFSRKNSTAKDETREHYDYFGVCYSFYIATCCIPQVTMLSFERIYVSSASLPDIIIARVIKFREGTWNRRKKKRYTRDNDISSVVRRISAVTIVQSW